MKYKQEQLKLMATRALDARDAGDVRYQSLVHAVAWYMNMHPKAVEQNIIEIAGRKK